MRQWFPLSAAKWSGLDIEVSGLDPLATFTFVNDPERVKMTTFTQEMLKRGFLAAGQFYASTQHKRQHIADYNAAVMDVFTEIGRGSVKLEGEPARAGFVRLV